MQIPIKLDHLKFAVKSVRRKTDFETKAELTAEDGRPIYTVTLVMGDGKDALEVRLRVDGEPGVQQLEMVTPINLIVNMADRKGETITWWSADGLVPVAAGETGRGRAARAEGAA